MRATELLESGFAPITDFIRAHAAEQGSRPALTDARTSISWSELADQVERIAARLQADGVARGDTIAIAGSNSIGFVLAFFGGLRAGACAALLTTSASPQSLRDMLTDSGARHLFLDRSIAERLNEVHDQVQLIAYDGAGVHPSLDEWSGGETSAQPVEIRPEDPFNIIYSSGTTGKPKGIVQSHAMRMAHMTRAGPAGFDPSATALYATPLYSNTTLVSFLAAVAGGSRSILMPRFDAREYCRVAERGKATHTILVPVQYQRMMDLPDFDSFDLSSFRYKASTSAPFSPELKRQVLRRWPGCLREFYGMTEGGGSCILKADEFPDKLHTVGQPAPGHDIRLIDQNGVEVAQGQVGEVVGRSPTMMTGYHRLPQQTAEAEWYDADGNRFIRHGDLARFDEDGFLILVGRAKDVIISGGFNIYPSDLEAELLKEPAVVEAAVVPGPSQQWGETPVAFVVLTDASVNLEKILDRANARLGKTQRISAIHLVDELPRSAIGKVLKRELRDRLARPPR